MRALPALAAALGLLPAAVLAAPADRASGAPFYLGFFTGADPVGWGDLLGKDTPSGIQGMLKDAAERGLNAVWVAGFDGWYAKEELIGVWLDEAARLGIQVALEGSGGPYALRKGSPELREHLEAEALPAWKRIAKKWKGRPALLAYCPVEEIADNADEWETNTGLRTLAGAETPMLAELGRIGRELKARYALLGRRKPEGPLAEQGMVLSRVFRDPAAGRYLVVANRDTEKSAGVPPALRGQGAPASLAPGAGAIVPLR